MDYERLTSSYWEHQVRRLEQLRLKINERALATTAGRVVPDDEELAIGTGRRLPLAIMFLDISGYSSRPSGSSAEQELLLRILNLFFSEMIKIAEDYGGTVEKNTGDGLMAYFEDKAESPAADGTKRAVACALTMMDASTHLINPILRASGVVDITFRISIDYGTVTIARLGAPRRFNSIVAVGSPANFAAKMLRLAGSGDILLGANAYWRLPETWRLRWVRLFRTDTGWVYRGTNVPYPVYNYVGRWASPL